MKKSAKKPIKKPLQYKLKSIELLSVDHPVFSINLNKTKEQVLFNFDLEVNNKINLELSLIFSIIKVTIKYEGKFIGSIHTSTIFEIANFKEMITLNKEGMYEIYPPLTEVLNRIAIGTTRGIMFSHFKGTSLHNAFLPIIEKEDRIEEIGA